MKIIGHRGAAGLALENSIESIESAIAAGVDAIEFDVRLTSDKHFVLSHDTTTKRVSPHHYGIHDETIAVLTQVLLHNGETIPSLEQALDAAGAVPVYIEVKGSQWARSLATFLKKRELHNVNVIAMDHDELIRFHEYMPRVHVYAIQKFHATELFQTFKTAERAGLNGIDMNFWLLNPLTYWIARRKKLEVIVYTVNYAWIARFLRRFFPEIAITTNHPTRLSFLQDDAEPARKYS